MEYKPKNEKQQNKNVVNVTRDARGNLIAGEE